MKREFPVIDADGHVIEDIKQLREFLPGAYQKEEGKREYVLLPRDGWMRGALTPRKREDPDPKRWMAFLDACGISTTVLTELKGRPVASDPIFWKTVSAPASSIASASEKTFEMD